MRKILYFKKNIFIISISFCLDKSSTWDLQNAKLPELHLYNLQNVHALKKGNCANR